MEGAQKKIAPKHRQTKKNQGFEKNVTGAKEGEPHRQENALAPHMLQGRSLRLFSSFPAKSVRTAAG